MESICRLKDIYKALYNFEKEFADKNGITINEGMILCCLKDGKPKSANELCEFIGLSNSRVSRVINTVETKGYIVREMGIVDKRQMIFTLSESGERKVKEMLEKEMNFEELRSLFLVLGE
uniref:MarR family winged helix-turn-helix transcriptional regulator n=1 Tax=uncultured Dysgonomonas sp. TaxID=206096 RepID=UPI00261A7FED|nr:winged helix DNA-binding protein [uncultured Dysgonomonas sp.]